VKQPYPQPPVFHLPQFERKWRASSPPWSAA